MTYDDQMLETYPRDFSVDKGLLGAVHPGARARACTTTIPGSTRVAEGLY